MAGLRQGRLLVAHQAGCLGSTFAISTILKIRLRQGLNNITAGTLGDVRTLCKQGRLKEAVDILDQQGIWADSNTYVSLLRECINMKALAEGKQLHAHLIRRDYKPNIFVVSALVNMYAKCGSIVDAQQVFDEMPQRNVFTWTMLMAGYAKHGCAEEAFRIYEQMQKERVMPNRVTFICILNACASLRALGRTKQVHADIMNAGIGSYVNLENAIMDTYAKCGSIKEARQVFDKMSERDVVSWSVMIAGYTQFGHGEEALNIYKLMQREGTMPNRVTFICALNACACLVNLEKGKLIHADIIKAGTGPYINLENALVDMYAKCGSVKDARQVFDNMAKHDVVSWTAMITGYTQIGDCKEALEIYEQMLWEGVTPDRVTLICVLNACANVGALDKGRWLHGHIIKAGISPHTKLENSLVGMYAKCGSVNDARQVFDRMAKRDVVSWNAMIAGYAQHGCSREALQLFEQMQQEGLKPDGITFTSVISACSHGGLVDDGCRHFDCLSRVHGLTPTLEHFGCMVDLLGRAGRLHEAEDFINNTSIQPSVSAWAALLGACRTHGNVEVAERVANHILKRDSDLCKD